MKITHILALVTVGFIIGWMSFDGFIKPVLCYRQAGEPFRDWSK